MAKKRLLSNEYEMAEALGVTRQRAHQILLRALKNFRLNWIRLFGTQSWEDLADGRAVKERYDMQAAQRIAAQERRARSKEKCNGE